MKEVSQVTAAFVDHGGLYLPLALKLGESYKRLLYVDPCEVAFPKVNQAVIGDGFETIEQVNSFWPHKKEIDLFIFPDSQGGELQRELSTQGFPVWGSFEAEKLELSREYFHKILKDVGLEVPTFERVKGISGLREHVRDKQEKYIKISKFRGSLETFHWRSWADDSNVLDLWSVRFGGVADKIPFLVFDEIPTDIEIGGDTYNILGQWPNVMCDGTEAKDKGYIGAFKEMRDMPEQTQTVMDAFGPVLGKLGMKNFWSMEIRVTGDKAYFIDSTPRGPLPGTGSQMELYGNLPEIILAGSHGELVDPDPAAFFSAECILTMKGDKELWGSLEVPKPLERWMKLGGACKVDGRLCFPPDDSHAQEIGWLVAIGDSPRETIKKILGYAKELPSGVTAATESLVDILKEIESAKEEGIVMTEQKMPTPAEVVE